MQLLVFQIMMEYISQRMQEMVSAANHDDRPKFGKLQILRNSEAFLEAIDHEHKDTTVFVHIYAPGGQGCDALNACLNTLAEVSAEEILSPNRYHYY